MMLARRNYNAAPLFELRRELDRLFDSFGGESPFGALRTQAYPALNVWETGERVLVEAEVPGLALDDLELLVQGNELTIKGSRPAMTGEKVVYHRRERGTEEFVRYLTLPADVDADKVEAALKNGVLTIVLPKSAKARARKITVRNA